MKQKLEYIDEYGVVRDLKREQRCMKCKNLFLTNSLRGRRMCDNCNLQVARKRYGSKSNYSKITKYSDKTIKTMIEIINKNKVAKEEWEQLKK